MPYRGEGARVTVVEGGERMSEGVDAAGEQLASSTPPANKALFAGEEDEDGEADENVLFEFELETSLGVIEVTVRKGEDVRTLVDDLRSSNPGALTRRQADKLVDTLAGRQLQEEQNGASYEQRHTQKVPAL